MTEREQVELEFEELKVRKGSPITVNGKEGEIRGDHGRAAAGCEQACDHPLEAGSGAP